MVNKIDTYRGVKRSLIAKWLKLPPKTYKVPIIGGINNWYYVVAPNKTIARWMAEGQLNAGIKVKGKIVEVSN